MIQTVSLIVLFAVLLAAQPSAAPCCTCGAQQTADTVCLSSKEMRDHVDHVEPLKPSGLEKNLNIAGIVVIDVRFEPDGSVSCARARSGHPIAISAAMEAIRKWTFKPVLSNGVAKGACGSITIKYRLRQQGSSTTLQ
jgi:TonB family protein